MVVAAVVAPSQVSCCLVYFLGFFYCETGMQNLERKLKTAYCLESHPAAHVSLAQVTVIGRHPHGLNDSRLLTVLDAQSPFKFLAVIFRHCRHGSFL